MTLSGVTLAPLDALPGGAQLVSRTSRPKFRDGEPLDFIEGYLLGRRRFERYVFQSGRVEVYERVTLAGADELENAATEGGGGPDSAI